MTDREDAERSDPRAPWNLFDATFCSKHPDIELEVVSGEDEDGPYFFEVCKICEE
tara:strand:+ start:2476 stop:2640 length:165 start_codon:yes stop_codon:yes gene_type:complete